MPIALHFNPGCAPLVCVAALLVGLYLALKAPQSKNAATAEERRKEAA